MKKLALLLMFWLVSMPLAFSQPLIDATGGGVPQTSITNTATSIPSSSTAVTLVAGSSHICICNTHATTILYVDLAGGTATSGDLPISPGTGQCWDNLPKIKTFNVFGSAASGIYGVMAW